MRKIKEVLRLKFDVGTLPDLVRSVREQGLEGLVAKRRAKNLVSS